MKSRQISQEAILSVGKEIVTQSGFDALNMRTIAQRCNISVGSVYNYFPSKGELVTATIASIWQEIIYDSHTGVKRLGFLETIQILFEKIYKGSEKYPSFFTVHPMSLPNIQKQQGREMMDRYFMHIKNGLLTSLEEDPEVIEDVFTDRFTKPAFVDFVFSNILTLLMNGKTSCEYLLEVVRQILY